MASRPRRAAAAKANNAITDLADSDNHINSRTGRIMPSRARKSEGSSKSRQSTSGRSGLARQVSRDSFPGGEIVAGKRNRSQKKSYVVDSSEEEEDEDEVPDEEEDAEGEDDEVEGEIVVPGDMDVDAEGEDDDDLDAEGEEDEMDVDSAPTAPTIKVSKPPARGAASSRAKPPAKPAPKATVARPRDSDDDDEDELSDLESEPEEIHDTVKVGGGDEEDEEEDADADEDAEGEDEEMEEAGAAGQDEDLDSDEEGSDGEPPDLTKMTKRQRARFVEEGEGELMKLSDEVQAKKVFTAEEQNMRRAEMARRRRNLSEKRNEEVKMETINKLLKKQAPKTNKKAALAEEELAQEQANRPNPTIIRYINNKDGSRVGIPSEMVDGPAGNVFRPGGLRGGKMVEEVL